MASRKEIASLFVSFNIDDKDFKKGLKSIDSGIKRVDKNTAKVSKTLTTMKRMAVSAFAGWGVKEIGRALVQTSLEVDRFHKRMDAAAGGGEKTTEAMKFFRSEIDRLGLSMLDSQKGFTNLLAAARLSGVGFEDVKKVFTGISEASVAMQMSSDDTAGALRAVVQIMSKGKAQAEELRGQLGERLPGAFGIAAKAMGVTTAELSNMLDRGEVLAKDLLPRFGEELHNAFGDAAVRNADSLNQNFQRLKTELAEVVEMLGEAGLNKALNEAVKLSVALLDNFQKIATGNISEIEKVARGGTQEQVDAMSQNLANLARMSEFLTSSTSTTMQTVGKAMQVYINNQQQLLENISTTSNVVRQKIIDGTKSVAAEWLITKKTVTDFRVAEMGYDKELDERNQKRQKILDEIIEAEEKAAKKKAKAWLDDQKEAEKTASFIDKVTEEADRARLSHEALGMKGEMVWRGLGQTASWYDEELERVFGGIAENEMNTHLALLDDMTQQYPTLTQSLKDFGEDTKETLKDLGNEWNNWGKHLDTLTKDFGSHLHSSLSDSFFSLVKGDLDSLSDIWKSFADGLLKSVTNVVADMAISWGSKLIGGFLGLDEGAWNIKEDNLPTMLHEGEMVVPKSEADLVRDAWDTSEGMGMDMESMIEGQAAMNSYGAGKGGMDAIMGAGKGAIGSLGTGAGMALAGGMSWSDFASGAPGAIMGGAISGGFSSMLNGAGFGSTQANIGGKVGSLIGSLVMGPPGAIMGGVVGKIATELLGDALGFRQDDSLRDMMEDAGYSRSDSLDISQELGLAGKAGIEDLDYFGMTELVNATNVGRGGDGFAGAVDDFIDGIVEGWANPTSSYGSDWSSPGVEIGAGLPGGGTIFDGGGGDSGTGGTGGDFGGGDSGWGGASSDDGFWRHGTGVEGLPETGRYVGHEGEIVLSPEESNAFRRGGKGGGGGGNITINVQIDGKTIATAVAKESYRNPELNKAIRQVSKR